MADGGNFNEIDVRRVPLLRGSRDGLMKSRRQHSLVSLVCAIALAGLGAAKAQYVGGSASGFNPNGVFVGGAAIVVVPPNLVAPNAVPGGITLVPGTVVTPGVGGTVVTGTVPLAGTVGSAGVGNLDPGLGMIPISPGANGALYPPATYPQVGLPGTNQSALPQGPPSAAPFTNDVFPSVANCPAGVTFRNGTC
jgi:hypothetical protein